MIISDSKNGPKTRENSQIWWGWVKIGDKMEKCYFLKIPQWPDFENLGGHSHHQDVPKNPRAGHGTFFFIRVTFSSHVYTVHTEIWFNSDFYRSMWRSRQRYSSAFRRWWNLLEFVLTVNSGCSWKECRQSSTSYSDFSRWRGKVKSIAYLQSSTAHFTWLRRLRIWLNLFWHWEVCMRWRQRMGSP